MTQIRIPRQQVPLVDPRTGLVTREWFNSLNAVSGSVSDLTPEEAAIIAILMISGLKAIMFNGTAEAAFQ